MGKGLIHNRDFVMFGLQPWDIEIGSNFKNMAMEIARDNRVLYVNYPADRISLLRNKGEKRIQNRIKSIRTGEGVLLEEQPGLWVLNPPIVVESINWISNSWLYRKLGLVNGRRIARSIIKTMKELEMKDVILLIDNDFLRGYFLPDLVPHESFIFYIRDYLLSQPYFQKHGKEMEAGMIARADAVACNSLYLRDHAAAHNRNAFDIGQGCELDIFFPKPSGVPADLVQNGKPVIGYCGALLSSRLDIVLLDAIAKMRPDWNLVLIGPEDPQFQRSELHRRENVFFLGAKKPEELPAYMHHFDVCINPQAVNEMTLGNYPRKIDEYLATGRPVVATRTPAMELFRDHVELCDSPESYIESIAKLLEGEEEGAAAERIAFARSHTWEASVNALYKAITSVKKTYERQPG